MFKHVKPAHSNLHFSSDSSLTSSETESEYSGKDKNVYIKATKSLDFDGSDSNSDSQDSTILHTKMTSSCSFTSQAVIAYHPYVKRAVPVKTSIENNSCKKTYKGDHKITNLDSLRKLYKKIRF